MKAIHTMVWMQHPIRKGNGIINVTQNVNIELLRDAAVTETHNTMVIQRDVGLRGETNPDYKSHLYFLALDLHGFLPEIHADGGFRLAGKGSAGEAEG